MPDPTPPAVPDDCPGCHGRGGWYSPDNGQWVTCIHCVLAQAVRETKELRDKERAGERIQQGLTEFRMKGNAVAMNQTETFEWLRERSNRLDAAESSLRTAFAARQAAEMEADSWKLLYEQAAAERDRLAASEQREAELRAFIRDEVAIPCGHLPEVQCDGCLSCRAALLARTPEGK